MLVLCRSTISTKALMAGQKTPDKVEYIFTGQEAPYDFLDPIVRILAGEFDRKEAVSVGGGNSDV